MRPILILGRTGQVAWELRRALLPFGELVALDRLTNPRVDLADPCSLIQAVRELCPRLIVNAAAYTAVDEAEKAPEMAGKINAAAPGILAEEAIRIGAGLIHYSTDYVFSGDADQPYREDDPTAPQGIYGLTKLAGEEAIRQSGVDHWILRTAWVYGSRGKNFLLTMLRLMRERDEIGVVADQTGSPTWSRVIAETTALMLARSHMNLTDTGGTYHLTCGGATSWYGFASQIRKKAIRLGLLPENTARMEAITTADYPTPAKRPNYSVLDTGRLTEAFSLQPPHWAKAFQLCLEDLAGIK